jgi:hypothetical protein
MNRLDIRDALADVGQCLEWPDKVQILLIGGAAAMLTAQVPPERVTLDCDVLHYCPPEAAQAVERAAREVSQHRELPANWLNAEAMALNVLPDGWQTRRKWIGSFGRLDVFAVGRRDLLAMKFYANRPVDREDISVMSPTSEELDFVQTYLNMLRVPSREANLDQVAAAMRLVATMRESRDHE